MTTRTTLALVAITLTLGLTPRLHAQTDSSSPPADGSTGATTSATTPTESASSAEPTPSVTPTSEPTPAPTEATPTVAPTSVPASAAASPAPVETPPAAEEDEECAAAAPVFDPSSPRLDISVGGGFAAYFVTWAQSRDLTMPGRHAAGLYSGPLVRAEVEFGLGSLAISANYTHIFSSHDGGGPNVDWALLSGEVGLQCACVGSTYVWGFGLEIGWDLNNDTLLAGIEHRSQFFVYEGLYLGFDLDVGLLVGLTSGGASGGGFEGSLFLGYSLG